VDGDARWDLGGAMGTELYVRKEGDGMVVGSGQLDLDVDARPICEAGRRGSGANLRQDV
jgi:hypothetical protein